MKPVTSYVELDEGWFSTSYVLRSPSGDELSRYDSREDAEEALRHLLGERDDGGLMSWLLA